MDKDFLSDRERSIEEEYFRRRDRELIEKMRQAAAAQQARTEMGEQTGLKDAELLQQLQTLGFTPETVVLLPLMPALQVAWADREIEAGERALIVKLARTRGIAEGSAADAQLTEWLARKPADHVFMHATRLIKAMIETAPDRPDLTAADLVRQAEAIADASGGVFGAFRRVSAEERQMLNELAQQLKH
jgi:tellurite resistance protein